MTTDPSTVQASRDWLDRAAGDFMLLDPKDLPAMAHFTKRLETPDVELALLAEPPGAGDALTALLNQAASHIRSIILEEVNDKDEAWTAVGKALESAQAIIRGAPLPDALDPAPNAGSTMAAPSPPDPATDSNASTETGAWLDPAIVTAYVEQQAAVLPEMEQRILDYEKERNPDNIADLRRMIHTLKGESGVVGALSIEQVCHRLEDYLDTAGPDVTTDVLLSVIDWIDNAVNAFGGNTTTEPADGVLQLLDQAPAPERDGPTPDASTQPAPDAASTAPIAITDKELASDFAVEAQEHFDAADENLMILEKDNHNSDAVGAVFRAFHTIKGVAGFLGLGPINDLAHAAETLLDEVRKGKRAFTGSTVETTFNALDMLKLLVADLRDALAADQDMPVQPDFKKVLENVKAVLAGDDSPPAHPTNEPSNTAVENGVPEGESTLAPNTQERTPSNASPTRDAGQTMKVDAARIDLLLDTIGELVIAEAIVAGDPEIRALKSLRVEKSMALLGKITRSLQDMGMSMRLVPVDPVFRKMARLVRDLSRKSSKEVELRIEGGDTEIDKSMVEKLGDPLVHMIRNSVDHGIESIEERKASGKPAIGTVVLRAYHKGGNIHIDIEDDGKGLDRTAIIEKAIERQLIRDGDGMSDQDVFSLIFAAGFSTAAQVTEISGRGVGMDVVHRNIEALRGNVLIRSTPGKGTVFTLVLPLTTAIIDGMLARVGSETYILPTLSILESFRPSRDQVHTVSGKGEMVAFRGSLLPVFRLSRIFNIGGNTSQDPCKAIIMVIEEYGKQWGIMVDDIIGQQQVVIKSLGDAIGQAPGIAGASILADGRPGLILDVSAVIRLATGNDTV